MISKLSICTIVTMAYTHIMEQKEFKASNTIRMAVFLRRFVLGEMILPDKRIMSKLKVKLHMTFIPLSKLSPLIQMNCEPRPILYFSTVHPASLALNCLLTYLAVTLLLTSL